MPMPQLTYFNPVVSWTPAGITARIAYQGAHGMNPNELGQFSNGLNDAIMAWATTNLCNFQPPPSVTGNGIIQYNFNGVQRAWPVIWTTNPVNWQFNVGVTVRVTNVQ